MPSISLSPLARLSGLMLEKSSFDSAEVRQKTMLLIANRSFAANARRLGLILRGGGGLTRAANAIEAVAVQRGVDAWLEDGDGDGESGGLPWHQVCARARMQCHH